MATGGIALKSVMARILECSTADIEESAAINDTVGWDSLSHINLMLELGRLGVAISPMQIAELTSYPVIRAHIEASGMAVHD